MSLWQKIKELFEVEDIREDIIYDGVKCKKDSFLHECLQVPKNWNKMKEEHLKQVESFKKDVSNFMEYDYDYKQFLPKSTTTTRQLNKLYDVAEKLKLTQIEVNNCSLELGILHDDWKKSRKECFEHRHYMERTYGVPISPVLKVLSGGFKSEKFTDKEAWDYWEDFYKQQDDLYDKEDK